MSKQLGGRGFRHQSDQRYLVMILLTLVVGGGGVIGLVYGWLAMLTALPFLLGGALLIFVPWWLLTAVQHWRDNMERAEREAIGAEDSDSHENEYNRRS